MGADNKSKDEPALEEHSDAWGRFEAAVDKVVKGGPQHRKATDKLDHPPPKDPRAGMRHL